MTFDAIDQEIYTGDFVTIKYKGSFQLALVTNIPANHDREGLSRYSTISTSRPVYYNRHGIAPYFAVVKRNFFRTGIVKVYNQQAYRTKPIEKSVSWGLIEGDVAQLLQIQTEVYEQIIANIGNPKFVMPKRFV